MIANENRARARDHFLTGDLVLSKTIFAAAAIAALIGTPAMAADMPVKAPPRTPVPVATSWTGCYVNGGVGHGLNSQDHFDFNTAGFKNRDETSGGRGWLGTVGGGCDISSVPPTAGALGSSARSPITTSWIFMG